MGFSVSGSAVIVFIGLVVAAGIAVPPLLGSAGNLASAQGTQIDQGTDRLNTDVEIAAATHDSDGDELDLELENTGTTTLAVADTDLLVDGVIQTEADDGLETDVDGNGDAELWLPGETLTLTVDAAAAPDRVKVVTENGIERATGDIDDGGT